MSTVAIERISTVRISPDNGSVLENLGLLAEFAGTWQGEGFNLIARPNFEGNANLYLQLNQTRETLTVDPIGSSIPNRGFGQGDIELFGLTYLQKISDAATGGALHIEPGIWVTQPPTSYPLETANPENITPATAQIVARMGSIPHGNALLAQGAAETFSGPPILTTPAAPYSFSKFPAFNSTPFPAASAPILNAAGSSEKATAAANGKPPFEEYDLTVAASAANPRSPFGTNPPSPNLPESIRGIPMQDVINDPISILQAVVKEQTATGHTFEGTVINIATQATVNFTANPNGLQTDAPVAVSVTDGAGGIENIPFLEGGEPVGASGANADTALVYATFWIEKVSHPLRPSFMQLQYAQMVILNFPILAALPAVIPIGWPHISVGTLRKSFN